jgi:hypothetical protein
MFSFFKAFLFHRTGRVWIEGSLNAFTYSVWPARNFYIMKNLFSCCIASLFFLFSIHKGYCQITISQMPLSSLSCQVNDAWNLSVFNPYQKPVRIVLQAEVRMNGESAADLSSGTLEIQPGATLLNKKNVSGSKLNYTNKDLAEIEASTGSLPPGNFEFCVWASCVDPDCDGLGNAVGKGAMCMSVTIVPSSPLILIFPENKSELEINRPAFSWAPSVIFSRSLSSEYEFSLVQMEEGQSAQEAIVRNRPLVNTRGLRNTIFQYPPDLMPLEYNQNYAWQVKSWIGNTPLNSSEVWQFRIPKDTVPEVLDTIRFCELRKTLDATVYSYKKSDNLYFIFREKYNNTDLNFKIYDARRTVVANEVIRLIDTDKQRDKDAGDLKSLGDNKYQIPLNQYYLEPGFYTLEVYTLSNETWLLKFEIK